MRYLSHKQILISLLIGLSLSGLVNYKTYCRDWEDIDFPRIIFQDAVTHYLWYRAKSGIPIPAPAVTPHHYEMLDSLGINIISTFIDYRSEDAVRFASLSPEFNKPGISVLMNPWIPNDGTMLRFHLFNYTDGIGLEGDAGDFHQRLKTSKFGQIITQSKDGRKIVRGENAGLGKWGQEVFLSSGGDQGMEGDYFCRPIFQHSPSERKGHLLVQAWTDRDNFISEWGTPILEIRLWESMRGNPQSTYDLQKSWEFEFNTRGSPLLTTSPDTFDLSAWAMQQNNPLLIRQKVGGREAQYNLEFLIGKGEGEEYPSQVSIGWIGFYDEKGWTAVYMQKHPQAMPDEGYPSYKVWTDSVNQMLNSYYTIDKNDLIIDWCKDDVSNHALSVFASIHKILSDNARPENFIPCQAWSDDWSTNQIGEYLGELGSNEWIYSWFYPLRCGGNLENDLDWFIEHNLRFMQKEVIRGGKYKLISLIQCHGDYSPGGNPKKYREPENLAELLVQGYLVLAYGARGIGYYPFNPQYYADERSFGQMLMSGLFQVSKDGSDWVPARCRDGSRKTDAIYQLNCEIEKIKLYLNNLKWSGGRTFGRDETAPQLTHISRVECQNPVEVCEFEPQKAEDIIPQGYYFMAVNRDVYSSQSIHIITDFYPQKTGTKKGVYKMQDLSSGKIYNDTKGVPGFDAEVELPAGTGKLFRIYQQ